MVLVREANPRHVTCMTSDKVKELAALREKLATLEQQVAAERSKEFASLPAKYGFESAEDFIDAVRASSGGKGRRGRRPGSAKAANGARKKRRRRATITNEMRAQVKKLVADGKTGNEIAKTVGISLPSVQNIKKALGLVQGRKK